MELKEKTKKALLIIDVQSYFLKTAPKELPAKIASHIMSSSYDLLAFTVFRNLHGSNWEKSLGWNRCQSPEDIRLPREFSDLATPNNTYEKNTYSALKHPQGLIKELQQKYIQKLDLCGIDTEACVLATAYDAFDHGYQINVLFDLCYSRPGLDDAAKKIILRTLQTKT